MASLTMASPNTQAIRVAKAPFIPQKREIMSIGHALVSLYPKVDKTMSDSEKVLAFQHNRTALAGADLDQRLIEFDDDGRSRPRRMETQAV